MTPHRSNGRGTMLVKMQVKGIGLIKRASGTNDENELEEIKTGLKALRSGRRDILRGIKGGWITIPDWWTAHRTGRLDELPTAEEIPALGPIEQPKPTKEDTAKGVTPKRVRLGKVGEWLVSRQREADAGNLAHHTVANDRSAWRRLMGYRKHAVVADVPLLVRKDRDKMVAQPRAYTVARTSALAFLRDTLGTTHRLYTEVTAIPTRSQKPKRVPQVLTVAEFHAMMAKAEKKDAVNAPCLWSMAVMGTIPKEYYGPWYTRPDRIHIAGTKTDKTTGGRVRDVPLVPGVVAPRCGERKLARLLEHATDGRCQLKDLRNTYLALLAEARIPRARRKMYMGHAKQDTTDLYEDWEVTKFLLDDGRAIRAALGVEGQQIQLHKES